MSNASTTTAVYEAAQELHAMGTEITRHTIAELTQLPMVVVDDRLRALAVLMAGAAFVAASTAHEARLADALARLQLPVGTQL